MFSNSSLRRSARTFSGCLLAAASFLLPRIAAGQSIVYSGVQSTLYGPVNYSYTPSPIAADGKGDVFFIIRGNEEHYYLEQIPSGGRTPTVLNNNLGFNPSAIAVNQAGTQISVIYSGTSRSCNGHYNSIYISQATLGGNSVTFSSLPCTFTMSGSNGYYSQPSGLAYDSSGTLYIADSNAHVLYAISSGTKPTSALQLSNSSDPIDLAIASNGTVDLLLDNGSTNGVGYVATSQFNPNLNGTNGNAVTPTSLITGISADDTTLAVDSIGNVYVANSVIGPVRRIFGGAINNKVDSRFGGGVYGLATDSSGNLYVSGANSSSQLLIGEDGQIDAGNFGKVDVGSSASYSYTFLSNSPVTVSNLNALTQGTSGLDYQITNHSCSGTTYTTCTVTVQFSPSEPGLRSGAVVLTNSSGGVLGTGYLQGIGTAPAVAYGPGTQNTPASGMTNPTAIVLDGSNNIYVALGTTGTIAKIVDGTPTNVITDLDSPQALAFDGAGNLYFATASGTVVEVAPNGTEDTVANGIGNPEALAVDGNGTLYILDSEAQSLLRLPQGGSLSTWIKGLTTPGGIAADSAGNVYIGNDGGSQVLQITSGGTQSTLLSSLNGVEGLAVDAAGDLYLSSPLQGTILESPAGCTVADCQISLGSGTTGLSALTLDSAGNLYYSQAGANANVYELNRTTAPSLSFDTTNVGSTSSDSPQSVTIGNIGNEALAATSPGLSVGSGFQQVNGSGTPIDCTTTFSLSAGASCNLSISFEPTEGGDISSSAVLTDNALNGNPATQTISLSGTAIAITVSPSSLTAATVGQPYSTTFTASGGATPYTFSLSGGSLPAGLQLTSGGVLSGTPTAAGSFSFTLSVTDNNSQTITQDYTLTSNTPTIVLTPSILPEGTVGLGFTSSITASGGTPSYTLAVSAGGLPPGVNLGANGALTGTPTAAGTYYFTITATDSSTGTGSPFSGSQSYSVQIAKGTPTIRWAPPAAISYGTTLSATQLDATANVAGGFAYSPAAGTVLSAGVHTLGTTFTPTDQADYTTQTASIQISVNKAATTLTLGSSTPNSNLDAQLTFTATVQSTAPGPATGSVEFLDGSTVLGTSTLNGQGTTTYVTSTLTAGTHTINAVYSGDGNFLGSSSSLNQLVTAPAYSISATPTALTLAAGQSGTITLTLTPVGGFTGTVALGCTGLPNWVSCQATPQTLTADGSNTPQTSQLLITSLGPNSGTVNNISSSTGGQRGLGRGNGSRVVTASFFFLPALLLGGFLARERKKLGGGWKCVLMLLILVSTMSGMVGCGFSQSGAPQGSYTVTVTGTSSATSALYKGPSNEMVNFTLTITH